MISCLKPFVILIEIAIGKVINALTNKIPTTRMDAEITIATIIINKNCIHFGMPITVAYSSSNDRINISL